MHLEQELRKALERQNPSPGFAVRVAAKTATAAKLAPPPSSTGWRMAWAAVLLLGMMLHSQYSERRAERAAGDAVSALRIASEKLNAARGKVLERASKPLRKSEN